MEESESQHPEPLMRWKVHMHYLENAFTSLPVDVVFLRQLVHISVDVQEQIRIRSVLIGIASTGEEVVEGW